MSAVAQLRRLWQHATWADGEIARALDACAHVPEATWREYAHLLGAEAVWLDRLLGRTPRVPVWPELDREATRALRHSLAAEYTAYLDTLEEKSLGAPVDYVNSAGARFSTSAGDILLQVMLHGQYHRGRINLMLRQADEQPTPTDYIAFVRGAPAATRQ